MWVMYFNHHPNHPMIMIWVIYFDGHPSYPSYPIITSGVGDEL
jgi:hypothetical protein